MSVIHTITQTIERDEIEYEIEVDYSVTQYYPACMPSLSDPGEPACGGEIDHLEANCDGEPITLTDAEIKRIEDYIYDNHDYSEDE